MPCVASATHAPGSALSSPPPPPHPALSTHCRSVLSLDDDILMPCSTIEAGFARWRAAPQHLLGFYPRLLLPEAEGRQVLQARGNRKSQRRGKRGTGSGSGTGGGTGGSPPGEAAAAAVPVPPPVYRFEEFVFQAGQYNAILAGAAFMDSAALFPAYFSAAAAPARSLVDEVFNCDDILLNFVAANLSRAAASAAAAARAGDGDSSRRLGAAEVAEAEVLLPPVQLMRPQRRIDVSRLSGVGERCCRAGPGILGAVGFVFDLPACLPTTANCCCACRPQRGTSWMSPAPLPVLSPLPPYLQASATTRHVSRRRPTAAWPSSPSCLGAPRCRCSRFQLTMAAPQTATCGRLTACTYKRQVTAAICLHMTQH